jgi:hypothetical protein
MTTQRVQRLVNDLADAGYSPDTVHNALEVGKPLSPRNVLRHFALAKVRAGLVRGTTTKGRGTRRVLQRKRNAKTTRGTGGCDCTTCATPARRCWASSASRSG